MVYNTKLAVICEGRWNSAGKREHLLKNSREQGTFAEKPPGTGNIGLKTAGNREHRTPHSEPHSHSSQIVLRVV